jgi:hypothetical protein
MKTLISRKPLISMHRNNLYEAGIVNLEHT